MRYYLDTEFLEGKQRDRIFGIDSYKVGKAIDLIALVIGVALLLVQPLIGIIVIIASIFFMVFFGRNSYDTKDTIDLISIGIVSQNEDNYYAVSREFNLNEAWYRHDILEDGTKLYWIRENVLLPIWEEYATMYEVKTGTDLAFTKNNLEYLLDRYGRTKKEIAEEVKEFLAHTENPELHPEDYHYKKDDHDFRGVSFYADYCSYDWVVFCWLFGKMIDLPRGFPMYCNDLQQIYVNRIQEKLTAHCYLTVNGKKKQFAAEQINNEDYREVRAWLKTLDTFPTNSIPHHALHDAIYDKDLHEFLMEI